MRVLEVERVYALTRIEAGDYLLPSNDGQTLWRFSKYVDGPSLGLADWSSDREVWRVRSMPMPASGELGRWEVDLEAWVDVATCLPTRRACIEYAMRRELANG